MKQDLRVVWRTALHPWGVGALLLLGALVPLHAQTANSWLGGSSNWDIATKWSLGTVPADTDYLWITNTASSYTVSVGSSTDPSTLSNMGFQVGMDLVSSSTQTLNIVNAPVTIMENSVTSSVQRSGVVSISGSTLMVSNMLLMRSGTVFATNSTIQVFGANANLILRGSSGSSAPASSLTMSGGALIVTNSAGTGILNVGNALGNADTGFLTVSNTLLLIDKLSEGINAGDFGYLSIQNTGMTTTNVINSFSLGAGSGQAGTGIVDMVGGIILTTLGGGMGGGLSYGAVTNRGATWIVPRNIAVGTGSNGVGVLAVQGGTNILHDTGGTTGRLLLGNVAYATGTVMISSGAIYSDKAIEIGVLGKGNYIQSGGLVAVTNGSSGIVRLGVSSGEGSFSQSGGLLVADILQIGSNATDFSVGSAGTVVIRGATGFSNAFLAADSNAFAFEGTLKFSPLTATMTQQLMLAGSDFGTGLAAYSNNFALGTLDLSSLGPNNRLRLLAPYSTATTALYVSAISSIATNALISSFNVYYDPRFNPSLYGGAPMGTYSLTGGGFLIPLPEPSSFLLLSMALVALKRLRR